MFWSISPSIEQLDTNDSDTAELSVNKNNPKSYTHDKRSKPTVHTPATTNVIDSADIDMIEDTTNAELMELSETLAESLVITDLKELMNAQAQSEAEIETVLPTWPMSPKGTFTYSF